MIYQFEDCVLDTKRRELRRNSVVRSVEPQVFDLLEFLIRNRERVVSRDEIFRAIWNHRLVSESALSTRINAAREAIGDNGLEQRLIRTLRHKGLHFVGAVREEKKSAPTLLSGQTPALSLADRPGIAVLPFVNVGGDPKHEYMADGMAGELITALSKANWFFVTSQNSSFAYKGKPIETKRVAHKLGVRYLLEGSVHQVGDRLRVIARLIDGVSDHTLWADRYDRELTDIFAMQCEITDKVTAAIAPQLYAAEDIRAKCKSPESLSAWECIVRALSLMNSREKSHVGAAGGLLQQALILDPKSVQARSLLSFVTTLRLHMAWTTPRSALPFALTTAHKALSLNPDEPWAHAAVGYAMIWKRPDEAVLALQHALSLNPSFSIAHYLIALASTYAGQRDDVFAHADKAQRFAPWDLLARGYAGAHNNVRATASFAAGHYHDGIEFARKSISECPSSPSAYRALAMNLALGGKTEEARRAIQTLKRFAPTMSQRWIKETAVWARNEERQKYFEAFSLAGLR